MNENTWPRGVGPASRQEDQADVQGMSTYDPHAAGMGDFPMMELFDRAFRAKKRKS